MILMNRRTRMRALFLVGLSASLACVGCQTSSDALPSPDQTESRQAVKVVQPERKTLKRTTKQPATVSAYHQAEIHAKVSGYLKDLEVDIGQEVNKNDVLAVIDVPELNRQREGRELVLERLKIEVKRVKAGIDLAKADVKASEASADQARAEIARAKAHLKADLADLQRVKALIASKAAEESLLDESHKRYEGAQAAQSAAESALSSALANIDVAKAKLATVEVDLELAKAETAVAQKKLDELDATIAYATLKAPFKGTITARTVDPGDLIRDTGQMAPGQTPLFKIVQLDRVRVQVALPENDVPWAKKGDPATLTLRAMPGKPFEGEISRVAKGLDEGSRTMLVEIDLPNPKGLLMPGMYGEAAIVLEEKTNCLVLPARSVRFDENGRSQVYVVNKAGTIEVVDVKTGLDDGKFIEIEAGLTGAENVVNGVVGRLKQGQAVRLE